MLNFSALRATRYAKNRKADTLLARIQTTAAAIIILAVTLIPATAADITSKFEAQSANSTTTIDHTVWDGLLQKYVVASDNDLNRVDYKAWKSNGHAALKAYLTALQETDPAQLNRNEQYAFWANLYNAKTIDIVLDHYPVSSIRKISLDTGLFSTLKKTVGAAGPWKTPVLTVMGSKISLDDIEHKILRPVFKDPRVHYAVNCASIGCPNLATSAFTGANIDDLLDANARAYVNARRGIRIDDGSIIASSIYSWFQSDFGGDEAGVIAHAKKYANDDLRQELQNSTGISSYDYDWTLNDIAK